MKISFLRLLPFQVVTSCRVIPRTLLLGALALLVGSGIGLSVSQVEALDSRLLLARKHPLKGVEPEEQAQPFASARNRSNNDSSDDERDGFLGNLFGPFWVPLGPSPIPNGQTIGAPPQIPVSGRVNAIAVDPRNPNIIYVGPAQGGVFRSLDGGQSWIELLGRARSLAVGSIAIDPLDHDKVVVGTGEGNFSLASHFGAGVYVIEEATSWHPRLKGPYNLGPDGSNVLAYRSITSVLVNPTNDNIVFVTTSSAFGGLGG